ncbi:holo-ACP synthase [Sphingomonas zeae]|uniref:Holo-ACP synthase n=1 Tax=Sphingomonas zeae TaxID=1646122 RepID=A0A7Y6B3P9_9SPHN|nr:holo-ACP synthase [Sphingomonas zeae]
MLLGVGLDLCRIAPIRRSVDRLGKPWLEELFTEAEQAELARSPDLAISAGRGFAAKEASAKALSTGFGDGVHWLDFETGPAETVTLVRLQGRACDYVRALLPAEIIIECQTWLSLDRGWAVAVALMSDRSSNLSQTITWSTISETVVKSLSSY